MKKIGIDISQIIYGTGASVYTKNLVKHLLEVDKDSQYILLGGSLRRGKDILDIANQFSGNYKTKITRLSPSLADLIWNRLHTLPVEYLTGSIDVFHSSDWTQPPSKARSVTTVHDLAPLVHPEWTDPLIVQVHQRRLKWVKKEADVIIVPSMATKIDLVDHGFAEEKIKVIYEAPEIIKMPDKKEITLVLNKYGIRSKYYLAIGANSRKNVNKIVEAFETLNMPDTDLVIIGRKSVEIKSTDTIKFIGHVDETDRIALLAATMALVYPSLYEGFGLPILDAFTVGTPVVTSNISSMPEVAGNAALLVDPYSVPAIAEGMHEILKERDKWIKKGFDRIKYFSWEQAAKETLGVYMQ